MQNYYDILGVDRNASFEQLKAAYRKKALECHPDRGGSHKAMVEINEAWHVLSDPKLRQQYDEQLQSGNSNEAAFEEARQRSRNYERDWRKFDSWLSSISRDFNSAEFGSKAFFGMEMPTASNSISAWVFLVAGGLVGFLVWLALFVSISQAWAPNEEVGPRSDFPFARMKQQRENNHFIPIFARVVMFSCVVFVATGAWAGKWTHQKFGARISNWLPTRMPFSFFSAAPAALDSGRAQSREPKPPPKQTPVLTQCPNCEQNLRVPSSTKSLTITCPKCETRFEFPNQNNQQEKTRMKFPPSKAALATLLRCMLIFEIVFTVITLGIGLFASTLGEQLLAEAGLVAPEVNTVEIAIFAVAFVVLLPLGIASWVGLFQHKNWGRWLYLICLLVSHLLFVFTSCFNWTYSWDLVAALDSIGYLTTGIILSICFLSPLASEFEQSSITNPS